MRFSVSVVGLFLAVPALAQDVDPLAPLDPSSSEQPASVPPAPQPVIVRPAPTPPPPPLPLVIPRDWRGVLSAINNREWEAARLGIQAMPEGPLKPYARAELYSAKESPRVELPAILALLAEAPELPQAEQLYRMAVSRG